MIINHRLRSVSLSQMTCEDRTDAGHIIAIAAASLMATILIVALSAQLGRAAVDLTEEEREWLAENPDKRTVFYDRMFPPIEYLAPDGEFKGIAADFMREIQGNLGFELTMVPAQNWTSQLEGLQSGDVPIVPVIAKTPERSEYALFSKSYISIPVVIITSKSRDELHHLDDFKGLRVAVVKNYVSEDYLRDNYAGHFEIVPVENVQIGLRDVSFGVVDALVENLAVAAYYIEQEKLPNLRVAGDTDLTYELSFAVSKKYPVLFSAMEKAMEDIPEATLKAMRDKWLSIGQEGGLSREEKRLLYLGLFIAITLILFMVLAISLLRRGLRQEKKKLAAAEVALDEKNERLKLSMQATNAAIWDLYPKTGEALFSDEWFSMLGYPPGEVPATIDGWASISHPDDFATTMGVLEDYMRQGGHGVFESEFRMRNSDGEWRWILGKGQVVEWDKEGQPNRLIGMNVDIHRNKQTQIALAESEALSMAIFNQAFNFFGLLDLEGRIIRVNQSALDVLLDQANGLSGTYFWDAPWWPDTELARTVCDEAMRTARQGLVYRCETRHVNKQGQEIIVDMSFSPFKDEHGQVVYLIPEGRDITEIVKSRRDLEESEHRFRTIFDNAPYAIFINSFDDGRFLDVNMTFLKSKGLTREQALAIDPERASGIPRQEQAAIRDTILRDGMFSGDAQIENADGSLTHVLFSTVSIPYGDEDAILSMVVDITDKKNAEIALAESEKKYREIFSNVPIGIFRTAYEGHFLEANPKIAEMFGYETPENLIAQVTDVAKEIYPAPEDRQRLIRALGRDPDGVTVEVEFKRRDGSPLYTIIHATLKKDDSSNPLFIEGTIEDITERKMAEQALRASERKFSELFLSSPDAIILSCLRTKKILEVNEAFLSILGYSRDDVIGKTGGEIGLFADPKQGEDFREKIRHGEALIGFEIELLRKNGTTVLFSISSKQLTIDGEQVLMIIGRNVTEQKHMQQMMIQTEKMISLGGIAAGIAHEINNPLGIVLQAVQNLAQRSRPDFKKNIQVASEIGLDLSLMERYMRQRQMDLFIEDIKDAAIRASGIVRHMLDFSRKSESQRTVCDLRSILDKAVMLAENDYDLKKHYDFKQIEILRQYDDEIVSVSCTETEMEQVFLNLLRNAAQALMTQESPKEPPRLVLRVLSRKDTLRVEIEDNGPGIPDEMPNRVFEPFYTTKQPNEGTGLGLSVSYFIVTTGHGGSMSVKSKPSVGTTFILELPALNHGAVNDSTSSNSCP